MWQNVQGYYSSYPYLQHNCSSLNCLNPYCNCNYNPQYRLEQGNKATYNQQQFDLKSQMRRLWGEHVSWIRMTIVSLVLDLPDSGPVVDRLLRTADDMGNTIEPFYGRQVADTYTQLLKEHISLAGDLIAASKKGDTEKASRIEKAWFKNGDEISAFLNKINPFIPLSRFRELFYSHLDMSKQQAASMIQGDYKTSVDLYDMMITDGLEIADLISNGITQQFHNQNRFVY